MKSEVFALFFSATGNTRKAVRAVAKGIAKELSDGDFYSIDITSRDDRHGVYAFGQGDVFVLGLPTYAGRIPNKIEPYISGSVYGDGAFAIPIVTYGNRAFDDSLKELATIMAENGMILCGGAAVPSEHAFTDKLAKDMPTESDIQNLEEYGQKLGQAIKEENIKKISLSAVPGRDMEESEYYKPLKENGEPAMFLKALPVTDENKCTGCGECQSVCPMGCYRESLVEAQGTCIKCQGCVRICPVGAKHFEDEELLSHIKMLENNYSDAQNSILML